MDIHELLTELRSRDFRGWADTIDAYLANSVPLVSKEPDGKQRLGCGTLASVGMTVYYEGSQFTIAGLFETTANLSDSLGVPLRQAKLADLVAAPPEPLTPVEALRQIVAKYDDGTLLLHECIDAARDVLARETGGTP